MIKTKVTSKLIKYLIYQKNTLKQIINIFFGSKNYENRFKENKKINIKNYLEPKEIFKIFSNSDFLHLFYLKLGHLV